MPGVPKSQGCQSCKLRKIKVSRDVLNPSFATKQIIACGRDLTCSQCDETWPACCHCQTSKLICPGPAQLFKFVNTGFQVPGKKKRLKGSSPQQHGAEGVWHNLQLQRAHHSGTNAKGRSTVKDPVCQIYSPRAIAPTAGELSSMRLISHLEGGLQRIAHLGMTFVTKLPTRIQGSSCLRDSAELFCSALADFQHPESKQDLMLLPQYGKALRSLRLALMNEEAYKAETLAAVALMERASNWFDRQGKRFNIHSRAAIQMMKQRRTANADDELDVAVCNDLYGMEMFGWSIKSGQSSTKATDWKEALENVILTHQKISKGDSLMISDLEALSECCSHLNARISDFQSIFRQSLEAKARVGAAALDEEVSDMEATIAKSIQRLVGYGMKDGTMVLITDPNAIAGKRYDFADPTLCMLYLVMLFLQLVPLYILYETDRISGGKPGNALHARLRAVAIEAWMCIPYIRSSGQMAGVFPEAPLYATYEIADSKEKEYILDMLQHLDKNSGRLPPTRAAKEAFVLKNAGILMGRDPDSSYF
ncbi:unnamed protein product [Clonostachys rosea]|uniref:Zn(2)-C6 fungal-type domain-containing protein n=1 Tax=Bionectria ochroleuca TaxID=29856 RepID=A0ABY6UHY4_BIOOC|nr:unnamed protein product [Clonostachys rosea]